MVARQVIAFAIATWCGENALALNASLQISQYAHTPWTIREGAFESEILSIAQTPDGYLWLGTQFGLRRFDGVHSISWQPPENEQLPNSVIASLLVTRDGALWIGTFGGLARWKDGRLTNFTKLNGISAMALFESRDGTVWVGGGTNSSGRLCSIQGARVQCSGEDGRFGTTVLSISESDASLWVGAQSGLWQWTPGTPRCVATGVADDLNRSSDGTLVVVLNKAVRQLVHGELASYPALSNGPRYTAHWLLPDRDGGLWIGTFDQGLIHIHEGKLDRFNQADGLSGDGIQRLFEDREGSIWVATADGLDRFREFAVPTISAKQGLPSSLINSVLAARDGSVWLSSPLGLSRVADGRISVYRRQNGLRDERTLSLFETQRLWVFSRDGPSYFENDRFSPAARLEGRETNAVGQDENGDLWLSQGKGFVRLKEGNVAEQIAWPQLGHNAAAWALERDRKRGGLWLGFGDGLAYFKQGQVRESYTPAQGLGRGLVTGLQFDAAGALWASTEGGLSRLKDGRITTLSTRNGLPCDIVHWSMEDDDHAVWLSMSCGLARIARAELDAWVADPNRQVHPAMLDNSDGVRNQAYPYSAYWPRVSKAPDGKIWFVGPGGVSVLDPHSLALNKLPPPVHIERIAAGGNTYWENLWGQGTSEIRLPALIRDLRIDYTALSLAAPEKIRFKYKLEGEDPDWVDAGSRRQAFYTTLRPRSYTFRVAAANNSGVWNEAGAPFRFSVAAATYQTAWFKASCVVAGLALLWGLYQLRLRQIAGEFKARLEVRVGERTRLARDLHDTLLQSFHGLMLHLQIVSDLLPEGEAKGELEKTLDQADLAIAEGRNAVSDLRSSATTTNELAEAINALANEYGEGNPAKFSLVVRGEIRELQPLIRDEIYRIVGEALRNAFKHARAQHIEAEITYAERSIQLRVRDDGEGIPPGIFESGRAGHYGLPGMRERAAEIGGKLEIWSGIGKGTEIELNVAASIAYPSKPSRFRFFRA